MGNCSGPRKVYDYVVRCRILHSGISPALGARGFYLAIVLSLRIVLLHIQFFCNSFILCYLYFGCVLGLTLKCPEVNLGDPPLMLYFKTGSIDKARISRIIRTCFDDILMGFILGPTLGLRGNGAAKICKRVAAVMKPLSVP